MSAPTGKFDADTPRFKATRDQARRAIVGTLTAKDCAPHVCAAVECNWLMIAIDCSLYKKTSAMQATDAEILAELRECPPAPDFDRVEIPGERERDHRLASASKPLNLPAASCAEIVRLVDGFGISTSNPQNLI